MLYRNTTLYIVSGLAVRLTGVIYLPFITRRYSLGDIGGYILALAFSEVLLTVSTLGIPPSLGRFLPQYARDGRFALCWGTSLAGTIVGIAVSLIMVIIGAFSGLAPILGGSRDLLWAAWMLTASQALGGLALVAIRAEEKALRYTLVSLAGTAVELTGYGWILLFRDSPIADLLLASGIKWITIFLAGTAGRFSLRPVFSFPIMRRLLAYGLPMIPVGFASWIVVSSDRYWLALFVSSEAVGIYGILLRVLAPVMLVMRSFIASLDAHVFNMEQHRGLLYLENKLGVAPLLFGVPLFALSLAAVPGLRVLMSWIPLLPRQDWAVLRLVPLVFCGTYVYAVADLFGTHLQVQYKSRRCLAALSVAALINAVTAGLLVRLFAHAPHLAIEGALWATVGAWYALFLVQQWLSGCSMGRKFHVLFHVFGALFMVQYLIVRE